MAEKKADFSGWATKNDLKCSDGRTIRSGAFAHQDGKRVPLVWSHMHGDPTNILGHAILENRADGVYAHAYFNDTDKGQHSKSLVEHGDIVALSIYATKLTEQGKNVMHGQIAEVSLVMAGANPGASIEHVNIMHGDDVEQIDEEAIIYTGLSLEHSASDEPEEVEKVEKIEEVTVVTPEPVINHAEGDTKVADETETIQDIVETMSDKQKEVMYYLVGEAADGGDATAAHSDGDLVEITEDQAEFLEHYYTEGGSMNHNLFDQNGKTEGPTLSHDDLASIVTEGQKIGSMKDAFLAHAVEYGIENIDILFPDAQTLSNSPDVIGRRVEWVADFISSTRHSPFSRIKSTAVDITADEARAKGYVKGNLKKDEVIKLLKRVTTPTTIYKKQKLDRDDIVDITSLDVVVWIKAEMRVMLDEEIARAILIGDGREPDDEDKIDEDHLRPIAFDDEMYAHPITVPADISPEAIVEAVLRSRTYYKGTGTPNFYTTDSILTDLILVKDKMGRYLYPTEQELAARLRVSKIVVVEVMEDVPNLLGIVVNPADYTIGADKGGEINMFDDFDIDYNQYKYLIETRISGTLTKPKSAVIIKRVAGTVVSPSAPTYNATTHVITIPTTAGVVYKINDVTKTGTVTITETTEVEASPAANYSFPHNTDADWTYIYTA